MVLFAQGDNQRPSRVGFGLVFGAGFALPEEVKEPMAEVAAQDAEGPWGIAEAVGDLVGGELFEEIGAERLVLPVGRGLGFEEEPGFFR